MFRSLRVSLLQLSCVLTRYLTELSVAKFLYSKRHLIPRIMAKTAWDVCAVKEASLLVQATPGMQTIDAVKLLAQHHINAVPVVSEDGVLQDTFCQSDLRVMAKPAGITGLFQTLQNFLPFVKRHVKRPAVPISCLPVNLYFS
mmetsp:Transcript_26292/g.37441  ORF Transcript_26292/g.37441 Transcript_26292/m.37441 type:complete len:143 (+) Transcript_26292:399-827(+)